MNEWMKFNKKKKRGNRIIFKWRSEKLRKKTKNKKLKNILFKGLMEITFFLGKMGIFFPSYSYSSENIEEFWKRKEIFFIFLSF